MQLGMPPLLWPEPLLKGLHLAPVPPMAPERVSRPTLNKDELLIPSFRPCLSSPAPQCVLGEIPPLSDKNFRMTAVIPPSASSVGMCFSSSVHLLLSPMPSTYSWGNTHKHIHTPYTGTGSHVHTPTRVNTHTCKHTQRHMHILTQAHTMHTCTMHTQAHTCTPTHMLTHGLTCTFPHTDMQAHPSTHTYTHMYAQLLTDTESNAGTHVCIHEHTCMHTGTHMCTNIYMHTPTHAQHTHIGTRAHTHLQTRSHPPTTQSHRRLMPRSR